MHQHHHKPKASSKKLIIVSANFGGIDIIRPLKISDHYDGVYYTDCSTVEMSYPRNCEGWSKIIQPNFPRHDFSARLRAKYFKLQSHRLIETRGYQFICWMDSRISIADPDFLAKAIEVLQDLPENKRLMIFSHPSRSTVDEEYEAVNSMILAGNERVVAQYGSENMAEQMADNRDAGLDMTSKLLAGGFWIRELSPLMNQAWDDWWDQNLRYSIMDQLSLPLVLSKHGIEPQIISGNIYKNDVISLIKHTKVC